MQISPLQLEQVNHQIQALRDAGSFYGTSPSLRKRTFGTRTPSDS